MNQDDIFRLLLIVLLSANSQLNTLNKKESDINNQNGTDETPSFNYTAINELLIFAMLLKLFDYSDDNNTNPTPRNTTF